MPYVSRNTQNVIDGLARWPFDNKPEEFLPENNSEVISFLSEQAREQTPDEALQEQFTKNDFIRGLITVLATKHNISPQELMQEIKTAAGL